MANYYLVIIAVVLIAAAAVLFALRRRDAALPPAGDERLPKEPDPTQFAGEGLLDPVIAIPPDAVAAPAPSVGPPDDLTRLKGLGAKAADRLGALGIARYDQLAALSGPALAELDAQMGAFQGRIVRDRWVEQAGHLAAGDVAGFEAKFGKLGG